MKFRPNKRMTKKQLTSGPRLENQGKVGFPLAPPYSCPGRGEGTRWRLRGKEIRIAAKWPLAG